MEAETEKQEEKLSFEEIVKPVMKWLAENHHPHISIVIDATHAEMLEGVEGFTTDEFLKD